MTVALAAGLSPRGLALQRTFAAAFEAAKEHAKTAPHEVAQLFEMLAAHLRSAAPLALGALATLDVATIEPETSVRVDLGDGASYNLAIVDGFLRLQMFDVTGDETMHHFEVQAGKTFRDDLSRVLAAMGVR